MGLLNKLKNVLFEEEEIDIPDHDSKEEVIKEKEVSKKKEPVKMTFDDNDDDILSDRELFKAEPTFNFPVFDEKEFESVKQEEPAIVKPSKSAEVRTRVKTPTYMDLERGRSRTTIKDNRDYDYKEARKNRDSVRSEARKFTPSPVISPVYGVLDKNYKKEDIVVKTEEKKTIDVDSVRRKAFGTLEEDIEKTLNAPTKDFYKESYEETKHLDDLLKDTMEEVIPVSFKEEEPNLDIASFNIEEEPRKSKEEELEVLDRSVKKTVEEKLEDETLENDLFDLIDSMYDTREDGE